MVIYEAIKDNIGMHINKDLLKKYSNLGYEIYKIENDNRIKITKYDIEEVK